MGSICTSMASRLTGILNFAGGQTCGMTFAEAPSLDASPVVQLNASEDVNVI